MMRLAVAIAALLFITGYLHTKNSGSMDLSSKDNCIKSDDQLLSFRGSVSEHKLLGADPTLFSLTFETVNLTGGDITFMTGTYQTRIKIKSKSTTELKEKSKYEKDFMIIGRDRQGAPYIDYYYPSQQVVVRDYYNKQPITFSMEEWKSFVESFYPERVPAIPKETLEKYADWINRKRIIFSKYLDTRYGRPKSEDGSESDIPPLNRIPNGSDRDSGGGEELGGGSLIPLCNNYGNCGFTKEPKIQEINEDVYKDDKPTKFEIEVADSTLKRYRLSQESTEKTFTGTWILPDQNPEKTKLMQHLINFANEIKQECEKL